MSTLLDSSGTPIDLLAIVGPTASGKTALAIELAQRYNGQIICADSRTVYRGLSIGTAKPTQQEQAGIVHHGLDLVEPDQRFSAADFQRLARGWITDIRATGKLPILVGGTGLYVDGLLYGFEFGSAADPALRARAEAMSVTQLQQELTAKGIELPENKQNKRYLVRALEQGGINRSRQPLPQGIRILGLNPGIDTITERIKVRTNQMVAGGLLQETTWLFDTYGYDAPGAAAPAYRALRPYFESAMPLEQCISGAVTLERRLAKRQLTWFRRNPDITWYPSAAAASVASVN